MIWTALFKDMTAVVFNTNFNQPDEAADKARELASERDTEALCVIKGNCENNVYFL